MNKIKFLTEPEVRLIIDSIKGQGVRAARDRAILEVLFSTGLRVSELLDLKFADFAPELVKTAEKDLAGRTLEFSIVGKMGYARTIYFSPRALGALKKYIPRRSGRPGEGLFLIKPRAVQNMIKRRAAYVGLEATPHTFRHSFATDLLNKGVDLRVVQEFLGHRSITSTQIYTHLVSAQLKKIHQELYQ